MDQDLKQYLQEMEQRIGARVDVTEQRLVERMDQRIDASEHRLTERMRDMQAELLKAFLPSQEQNRQRDAALETRTNAVEARVNLVEGRLFEIEKKLLQNPPAA